MFPRYAGSDTSSFEEAVCKPMKLCLLIENLQSIDQLK